MDYANSRNLDEPSIDAEHIQDIHGAGKRGNSSRKKPIRQCSNILCL